MRKWIDEIFCPFKAKTLSPVSFSPKSPRIASCFNFSVGDFSISETISSELKSFGVEAVECSCGLFAKCHQMKWASITTAHHHHYTDKLYGDKINLLFRHLSLQLPHEFSTLPPVVLLHAANMRFFLYTIWIVSAALLPLFFISLSCNSWSGNILQLSVGWRQRQKPFPLSRKRTFYLSFVFSLGEFVFKCLSTNNKTIHHEVFSSLWYLLFLPAQHELVDHFWFKWLKLKLKFQ